MENVTICLIICESNVALKKKKSSATAQALLDGAASGAVLIAYGVGWEVGVCRMTTTQLYSRGIFPFLGLHATSSAGTDLHPMKRSKVNAPLMSHTAVAVG